MDDLEPSDLALIASQSQAGVPVYLDDRMPEIEDPSRDLASHEWQPACDITSKLTRCLEAVRDVATAVSPLVAAAHPVAEKRLLKQTITPVYSLAVAIRDLFNDVQSNHWTRIPVKVQRALRLAFERFGKAVPTTKGTLKTARDKLAAHLDKDTHTSNYRQFWNSFGTADVMGWIRGCVAMLRWLLAPDVYSWTRCSGYSNVDTIMNVDCREVSLLIMDGKPHSIVGMKFSASPKYGIERELAGLSDTCSGLCQRLGINEGTTWRLPEQETGLGPGRQSEPAGDTK